MANISISLICLLLAVLVPVINGRLMNGVNGGADCAGCTMFLGIIERVSVVYNETIISSLERICNYLPNEFRTYCKVAIEFLGKFNDLIQLKEKEKSYFRSDHYRWFREERNGRCHLPFTQNL